MKEEIRIGVMNGCRDERITRLTPITVLHGPTGIYAIGRLDLSGTSRESILRKLDAIDRACEIEGIDINKAIRAGISVGGLK